LQRVAVRSDGKPQTRGSPVRVPPRAQRAASDQGVICIARKKRAQFLQPRHIERTRACRWRPRSTGQRDCAQHRMQVDGHVLAVDGVACARAVPATGGRQGGCLLSRLHRRSRPTLASTCRAL
jgi:hypothetical protein